MSNSPDGENIGDFLAASVKMENEEEPPQKSIIYVTANVKIPLIFENNSESLSKTIRNGKLNLVDVGNLIIESHRMGLPTGCLIDDFVQISVWKVNGQMFTSAYLDPGNSQALQIGNYVMNEIISRKIESMRRTTPSTKQSLPTLDMGEVSGSILNIHQEFRIQADPPFKEYLINLSEFEHPRKSLKQHIVLRDYLYFILTKITDPPEAIRSYTYRNVPKGENYESENGSEDESVEMSDEERNGIEDYPSIEGKHQFKDLPEHVTKTLKALFLQYYGLDSPILSCNIMTNAELEACPDFRILGSDNDERLIALREKRRIWYNFTVLIFPAMLKNACCEIRLSSFTTINGKIVWTKRKRKAGFRAQLQAMKRKSTGNSKTKKAKQAKTANCDN
ncbi:unnamed protein product [Caenorhabditis bovis]|uniref:Uncharacterized protein n=1 Tax=Caenorhabditis bovis TaxID=2654633 RepID=A0A8S1EXZ4_9PELO|nr:unnamed protein product [Caenorhabditis bovis]